MELMSGIGQVHCKQCSFLRSHSPLGMVFGIEHKCLKSDKTDKTLHCTMLFPKESLSLGDDTWYRTLMLEIR